MTTTLPAAGSGLPAAVTEARSADDVVAAVRSATRRGVEVVATDGLVPVPESGHALLVHTGGLAECTVHEEGWARVGPGVRWAQVLRAAAPLGLAPLAGAASGGVVDDATAGGLGPVARAYGLASDRVRAFEVVTGEGVLRRVTPAEHPDLFWALRGGRQALGVVTAVEIELLAVDAVYAGRLVFAAADAAAVLAAWRAWSATLPAQGTTSVALLGDRVTVRFAWVGEPDAGAAVLAPLRACAEPLHDAVAVLPWAGLGALHEEPAATGAAAHLLLDALPPEALDGLLALAGPPRAVVELRRLGAAVARIPERPSAVSHRDAPFALRAVGPQECARAGTLLDAVGPWSSGRGFTGLTAGGPAGPPSRLYDPGTLRRLAELAAHHDPHRIIAAARPLLRRGRG